jgi:hypothetical protein
MATTVDATARPGLGIDRAHRRVITAASLGTMFEWYDFYLYGSLASIIGKQFFAASMRRPRSSSRCWHSPRVSLCGRSAR